MIERRDQMDRCVWVSPTPRRIVSLVPSQSELLVDLGLDDELVGVTKFCIHPSDLKKQKTIVGGTKEIKIDTIKALQPDLIIGNKEENQKELIEALAKDFPVWMSDIKSLDDALEMISLIGDLVGKPQEAEVLVQKIGSGFAGLIKKPNKRCVYLIWNEPIMAVGQDTFIDDMLSRAGFENVVRAARYPELDNERLKELSPEVILLSSEPFPFKQKHKAYFETLLPNSKVAFVDGELFSWYGSRLLSVPAYVKQLSS